MKLSPIAHEMREKILTNVYACSNMITDILSSLRAPIAIEREILILLINYIFHVFKMKRNGERNEVLFLSTFSFSCSRKKASKSLCSNNETVISQKSYFLRSSFLSLNPRGCYNRGYTLG